MSIVKQVSVYDGTQEKWDGPHDIGANASNVSLSSTMSGGTNVEDTLKKLVGANSRQLTGNKIVTTTQGGTLTTSTVSSASLEGLSDMVVTDDAGAPTEDVEFVSGDTTLTPASTSEVSLLTSSDSWSSRLNKISLMFRNIRYLISKLGTTDLTEIGDGTVTGAINTLNTDLNTLNTDFIDVKKIKHTVRNFTLSSGGSAQLTFSDGTPITYPKYNVIQCHTASSSSGGNTIALPITVYNNVFWISGRDTVNWNIVTNRNVSVDIIYYLI